jgi:hypothetical protein
MAALSTLSDNHPRWVKQGAHWVKTYPSSSSIHTASQRSSLEMKSAPLDTDVLLNILKVLRKLDCKMEVQGRRLEILETTSPTSNSGSTLVNTSPISRKQSTRTAASKRTLIPSEDGEDINEYGRSIMKMDYAIDEAVSFVNGDEDAAAKTAAAADVSVEGSEKMKTVTSWADLVPEPPDVDLYSVSMYTGDLLGSSMSLDVLRQTQATFTTPMRSLPSRPHSQLSHEDSNDDQSMEIEAWPEVLDEHNDVSIKTGDTDTVSRVESVAINTKVTNTNPTYVKIELAFHAVDTWKQGVVSKIKNDSKALWKDEKRRFNELRHTHRARDAVQRFFDKLRSAVEKEWKEEKERVKTLQPERKPGVKILRWRVVISFQNLFNVSREDSRKDIIC